MSNGKIDTSPSLTGWRKLMDDAIAGITAIPQGLLGLEPQGSGVGPTTNKLTQLLTAGLPLSQITRGRALFHGTNKSFSKFNPGLGRKKGTLSNLVHAAEYPEYAQMYATGLSGNKGGNPNIIPIKPTAKNVLDLANPNPDDISHALASLDPYARRTLIDDFKMNRSEQFDDETALERLAGLIREEFDVDPQAINRTQFDAIRYHTGGGPAVGFIPGRAPIQTPWGTDLSPNMAKEGLVGIGRRFPKFLPRKK